MKIRQKIKRIGAVMLALSMCVTMLTGCWLADPELLWEVAKEFEEIEAELAKEMAGGEAPENGRYYMSRSGFDPEVDGTGFIHSIEKPADYNAGLPCLSKAGRDVSAISAGDLINLFAFEPIGVTFNVLHEIDKLKKESKWPGYCNGAALLTALVYNGDVSLDSITNTGAEHFSELDPNTDPEFLSKILFYFYTQYTLNRNVKEFPSANTQKFPLEVCSNVHWNKRDSEGNVTDEERERLRKFFEKVYGLMQDGKVGILFAQYFSNSEKHGHALVVTGCYVEGEGDDREYGLELFDINSVGTKFANKAHKLEKGEDYDSWFGCLERIKIVSDYSDFFIDSGPSNIGFNFDNYNWLKFVGPERLSAIADAAENDPYTAYALLNDPVSLAAEGDAGLAGLDPSGPVQGIPEDHMWISVPDGEPFELTAGNGTFLKSEGGEITGDMAVYNAYTSDDADGQTLHIETDKTDVLTATSAGGIINVNALDNDNYLAVSAENADSAALTLGDGVDIIGENFTFDAYISTEPSESVGKGTPGKDIGDGLVSLAAGAEKTVSLKAEGTDVKTTSDGALTDVVMARYRGTEKFERTVEKSDGKLSFSSRLDIKDRIRRLFKELAERLRGVREYARRMLREFLPESVLKLGEEKQKERRLS